MPTNILEHIKSFKSSTLKKRKFLSFFAIAFLYGSHFSRQKCLVMVIFYFFAFCGVPRHFHQRRWFVEEIQDVILFQIRRSKLNRSTDVNMFMLQVFFDESLSWWLLLFSAHQFEVVNLLQLGEDEFAPHVCHLHLQLVDLKN